MDFVQHFLSLDGKSYATLAAAKEAGAATLNYGSFITVLIQFIIVAWAIFLLVKGVNALRRSQAEEPAAPPAPTAEEKVLVEIRDLLKSRAS